MNYTTVGVFSDVHAPFDHPMYLDFLTKTFKFYGVRKVICLGDLVDFHALSKYETEPCAMGAYDELDIAINTVGKYVEEFPCLHLTLGNHDLRPARQGKSVGLGERFLTSFRNLLKLPDTWEISEDLLFEDVLYKHGEKSGGKDGALNAAIQERMSTVIGHFHGFAGCKYSANKRDMVFGMNVGCGIDSDKYAFAYGKNDKCRPIRGCGIVFNPQKALFVPMTE